MASFINAERHGWRRCARAGALVAWVALGVGCSGGPKAEPGIGPFDPPAEQLAFEFDGREWTPGFQKREGRLSTEIYVLPGETPKEWTELVTRVLTLGGQRGANMDGLVKLKKATLEKDCPIVTFETLALERRSALYEWSRPQCKDQGPQTEIGRFVFGRLGIHLVTYTAKTSRVAPGLRRQWVEALRNAKLTLDEPGSAGDSATAPDPN